MWVQTEWSCPPTTPRTTPVDRSASILSPCPRTMVWRCCMSVCMFSDHFQGLQPFSVVSQSHSQLYALPLWERANSLLYRTPGCRCHEVEVGYTVGHIPDTCGRRGPGEASRTRGCSWGGTSQDSGKAGTPEASQHSLSLSRGAAVPG